MEGWVETHLEYAGPASTIPVMTAPTTTCPIPFSDTVCLGCGCLCDDIAATVEAGRITHLERACEMGRCWFAEAEKSGTEATAFIKGHVVDLEAALERAAELLVRARMPLILGLAAAAVEAQREAVALADALGGVIDAGTAESWARRDTIARVGQCTATLGEVSARADLVVFWGCDPAATHPRHLERYSAQPVGRFVPAGREGRTLIVVDDGENNTTRDLADDWLPLKTENRLAALQVLLAIVRGTQWDQARFAAAIDCGPSRWVALADRMKSARYGAVFTDGRMVDPVELEMLLLLTRDLNQRERGRFVHLTLGAGGNAAGAEAVLGWQAGFAPGVSFVQGYPSPLNRPVKADLVVEIGPNESQASDRELPRIRLGAWATDDNKCEVEIATAHVGTQVRGTVMRCDGISLPLRPILPTGRPDLAHVLRAIRERASAFAGVASP